MDIRENILQSMQTLFRSLDAENFIDSVAQNLSVVQDADFLEMAKPGISFGAIASYAAFPEIDAASLPDVGDVVADLGDAINEAILEANPDLAEDGQIQRIPQGASESEPEIFVINGIQMKHDSRVAMAEDASNLYGSPVNLVHNSSGGFILDSVEYLGETLLGIPSPPTEKLSDEIYANLTSDPPKKTEIMAYSQGSAQTSHALALTIQRLKEDGKSDEEIRQLMSENVKVTYVGTPVNFDNPMQTMLNVPPGPMGAFGKRLDWYFTVEDRLLHGGDPPTSQTIKRREDEGGEPNLVMIRHEDDPIATSLHDFGPLELLAVGDSLLMDPFAMVYVGFKAAAFGVQIGINFAETGDMAGYHDYQDIYSDYMRNGLGESTQVPSEQSADLKQQVNDKKQQKQEPLA